MEMNEKTLLGAEAKNILSGLISFTESNIPTMVSELKTITEHEFCLNISEIVKNNFSFSKSEEPQGLDKKVHTKSSIKIN